MQATYKRRVFVRMHASAPAWIAQRTRRREKKERNTRRRHERNSIRASTDRSTATSVHMNSLIIARLEDGDINDRRQLINDIFWPFNYSR